MVGSHRAIGRSTACSLLAIAVLAVACASSSTDLAVPTTANTETSPVTIPPDVASLTAMPSEVWGNGRALQAVPLPDGRTAVVTTIGVNILDGSDIVTLERFTSSTLISSVAVSDDASTLAVATTKPSQITWYDLAKDERVGRLELAPDFLTRTIKFSADATTLWMQTNNQLEAIRLSDSAITVSETFENQINGLALSDADGSLQLALVGTDQVATVAPQGGARVDTIAGIGDEGVVDTKLSPSGSLLATFIEPKSEFSGDPKRVVVVDPSSLAPQIELVLAPTATPRVWAMGDTHLAVSVGWDIELHAMASGEMTILSGPGESPPHSLFFSGSALVGVLEDGSIVRWATNDSAPEMLAAPAERVLESAAIASDGSRVVAIDRSGVITTVALTTTETVEPVTQGDFAAGEVTNVDIDSASSRIVGSTSRGDVVVLDPVLAEQSRFPVANGGVGELAFVPGSNAVVTGLNERTGELSFDDTVAAWDPATGEADFQIGGESEDVVGCSSFFNRIAFLNGGAVMATTSHDFTVGLIDTTTGEELFRFEPETSPLLDIAVTPDESKLIVSSEVGTYTVWDLADRSRIASVQAPVGGYRVLATLPDNRTMATTSLSGELGIVDIETGERLAELGNIGRTVGAPVAIALSADGALLTTATGADLVGVWSTSTGQQLATLAGHTSRVTDVAIAPDMTFLVTSSSDGTIRTWSLDIPEPG